MAFFGLFGGNRGKNEQTFAWNNLRSLIGDTHQRANAFALPGNEAQSASLNYFMPLLSGDRTQMEQAVAPEANAINARADATRAERARTGTSRTGGDVAANTSLADQVRAQLDTLIGTVRPQAAAAVENIGNKRIEQMMQALGLSASAASSLGSQATSQYNQSQAAAGQTAEDVMKLIGILATL